LNLGEGAGVAAELRCRRDRENLYLALTIPTPKPEDQEEEEEGPVDDLQIGLARRISSTDFGADFLRLGFSHENAEARNRTPGRKSESVVPGIRAVRRVRGAATHYEIGIPLRLIHHRRSEAVEPLILNVSFAIPEREGANGDEPTPFSYYVRYGTVD